jgi:plasmid stabilization system protein ParE
VSARYQIKYEPLAQSALEEAAAHIREDSGPERAAGWLRSILASLDKLETLPKAFGVWTQRGGQPVYSKPVPPYRVFYVVDDATLTVHAST